MKPAALFIIICLPLIAIGQAFERRIDSLILRADYTEALQQLQQHGTRSPLLINKEAQVKMALSKLDEAAALLNQVGNSPDGFLSAITETNQGLLQLLKGRSDLAQEQLEKARDQFKQIGKDNTAEAARCYASLCVVYSSLGNYKQAEEHGQQALQIRQTLFGDQSEETAASLNDLGLAYGATNAEKALDYYDRALAIYEKVYGKGHPKIAIASTNIGLMNLNLELYGDAINEFEKARTIWKTIYPQGHPNEAITLVNLGRTYAKMKNNATALSFYDQALQLYRKTYGTSHPDIAYVLNQIGNIQLTQKKYSLARTTFQQALTANSPGFNAATEDQNPSVRRYYNGKVLLYSLHLKAQALEAQYFGKTLRLHDLTLALSTLQSCDSLVDILRQHSTNESDKIELGGLANGIYEDGIRIAQAISEVVINKKQYQSTAFYFAEKSKAAVLQESIADTQAKTFAGIPPALLDDEKAKKSTIAFLSQKLSEKPGEQEMKYLQGALFDATLEYQQFIKKLEKDFPSYFNLKYNTSVASVHEIQQTLKPHQAVVSYYVAEKNRKVYQFVITDKKFHVDARSLPQDFERLCIGFVNSLLYNNFTTYAQIDGLRQLLKPNVSGSITELVILPSGRLSTLPFEALPFHKATKSFETTDYFIQHWAISYEFSAGLMLQKSKTKAASSDKGIYLCAPVKFGDDSRLSDLPGSEQEVRTISELFPGKAKVNLLTDANETILKTKEVEDYTILHFATHGLVDSNDPAQSEVFLATSDNDDGQLYCREIYNMRLGAELVVLSACETGLGRISSGEGVMGLSRALTYAGAKNLVVSFWKVSDESTTQLMISFYKHLLAQPEAHYSQSLRAAKLDILRQSQFSSPYHWAAFILIGK